MAQVERTKEDAKDTRRGRAKERRQRRGSLNGTVSIREADWVAIAAIITAFAEAGGAIRVGFTRDGGAYAFGCYCGDDYATEYVRPDEDLVTALAEIAALWLPEHPEAFHEAYNAYSNASKPQKGR